MNSSGNDDPSLRLIDLRGSTKIRYNDLIQFIDSACNITGA